MLKVPMAALVGVPPTIGVGGAPNCDLLTMTPEYTPVRSELACAPSTGPPLNAHT